MIHYSQRLVWTSSPNLLAQRLAERRQAGLPVLDLTVSSPAAAGIPGFSAASLAPLAQPGALQYQPHPLGLPDVRAAIASYYADLQVHVDPDQLCLTASTSEAYTHLFRLLADPGGEFLIPSPSYPLFDYLAALESVTLRPYPLRYDGQWYIDFAELAAAIGHQTRGLILVNPNNPTGSFLKQAELERLRALCADHGLPLIVDEVFADYPLACPADAVRTLAGERTAPTFVLSGLSKICALPQMKVGWIAVAGPEPFRQTAMARLELIADTFLSVATPNQLATPAWLAERHVVQAAIHQRIAANLATLRELLADTAVTLLPVEGGWYATLRLPATQTDEAWALQLLDEAGIYLHPGYFFNFATEACVVISLLTPGNILKTAMRHLASGTKYS